MDKAGLGKPYSIGDDDLDGKFRMCAIKLEDFIAGVLGDRRREAMR